jgi:hemerythrin-like domain-containing protein
MMPIGPLMIEHRLIEQVIEIMRNETEKVRNGKPMDVLFITTVVDFIQMYADRTHHGKEEDILFKDLLQKNISEKDKIIMEELIEEHLFARKTVKKLIDAQNQYGSGESSQLAIILGLFDELINLYPGHIKKEDRIFFPSVMKYYSKGEQEKMLEEMWRFDRSLIHEKYKSVVEKLKGG